MNLFVPGQRNNWRRLSWKLEATSSWKWWGPKTEAMDEEVEGGREESTDEVRKKRGKERRGRGVEGGRIEGEEKRQIMVLSNGLKARGPKMVLVEGPERRSGDLKTAEIGNNDFHSSDKFIIVSKKKKELFEYQTINDRHFKSSKTLFAYKHVTSSLPL